MISIGPDGWVWDSFDQAMESDLSDETESQDKILQEDLEVDSQYLWPDEEEPNIDIGTDEEMKDVEMCELEMDNVFPVVDTGFWRKASQRAVGCCGHSIKIIYPLT